MRRLTIIGFATGVVATTAAVAGLVAAGDEPTPVAPAATEVVPQTPSPSPSFPVGPPQFPSPPPNITPDTPSPRTPTPTPSGPTRPAGVPSGADLPKTPSIPKDARVLTLAEIGKGLQIGRMLVLPPGSVPYTGFSRATESETLRVFKGAGDKSVVDAAATGLAVGPGQPPSGYALVDGEVTAAMPKSGTAPRVLHEVYGFDSPTQYTLLIDVRTLPEGKNLEVVAWEPSVRRELSLKSISGVTVVFSHNALDNPNQPALRANFVIGNRAVVIEVSALPIEQLERYLEQFIAEHRAGYEVAK